MRVLVSLASGENLLPGVANSLLALCSHGFSLVHALGDACLPFLIKALVPS